MTVQWPEAKKYPLNPCLYGNRLWRIHGHLNLMNAGLFFHEIVLNGALGMLGRILTECWDHGGWPQ